MPPKIQNQQESFSPILNETLLIPCEAEGDPKPQISWYKNGELIVWDNKDGVIILSTGVYENISHVINLLHTGILFIKFNQLKTMIVPCYQ